MCLCTFRYHHSIVINGCVTGITWLVPLVKQTLLTLPEHLSCSPVFSGIRVARSLIFCVVFVDPCLSFCHFVLVIALSVRILITTSGYPFGSFNTFLPYLSQLLIFTNLFIHAVVADNCHSLCSFLSVNIDYSVVFFNS